MHDNLINFVWTTSGTDQWALAEKAGITETDTRRVNRLAPIAIGLSVGLNIVICCLTIRES